MVAVLNRKYGSAGLGCWFERDFVSELFELADESVSVSLCVFGLPADEVVIAEVVVGDVSGEDVPGGDEDRVGGRDRRFLMSAAATEALVVGGEVGAFAAAGGLRRFGQPGAQPFGA